MSKWYKSVALAAAFAVSATATSASASLPSHGDEFPEETAALVAATAALFEAIEAENDVEPRIPEIRIEGLAVPASLPVDAALTRAFPNEMGPVQYLTGYRINWYPVDRFLGAVDFMGTYDSNRNLVCGYIMWDVSDPDAPELDRVVANYIELDRLDAATPAEAHRVLLDANCAFGEIEPNFTVFDRAG
ncbi:MAG: hypothetical protein ACR2O1_10950 [Boseongicola sp.]